MGWWDSAHAPAWGGCQPVPHWGVNGEGRGPGKRCAGCGACWAVAASGQMSVNLSIMCGCGPRHHLPLLCTGRLSPTSAGSLACALSHLPPQGRGDRVSPELAWHSRACGAVRLYPCVGPTGGQRGQAWPTLSGLRQTPGCFRIYSAQWQAGLVCTRAVPCVGPCAGWWEPDVSSLPCALRPRSCPGWRACP